MAIGYGEACQKPEKRVTTKRRKVRQQLAETHTIRDYVFARERGICRVCRAHPAESMHEIRPRSLRGKVSKRNSIAACGSGTTGCHGFCQSKQIEIEGDILGAEDVLIIIPVTKQAAEHLKLAVSHRLVSAPLRQLEEE